MYCLLILAVALERLVELVVSKRNAGWAFARGGREFGRGHYPVMVAIHTALLIGCVVEVWLLHRPFLPWLGWPMLAVVLSAQILHWWCITTLGEAYVTPVESGLVAVAILSRHRPDLAWFPWLARRLGDVRCGPERGCGPMRRVVSRRVVGRVLFVGDAAGYEDALTGEGISLAVNEARAAIAAVAADGPAGYERAWRQVTRRYRLLTRGLVLGTQPQLARRAIVPVCGALPTAFARAVEMLAS